MKKFTRKEVIKLMAYLDNRIDNEIFDTYEEDLDDYLLSNNNLL
tara:strand:+ start:56 stop:187 length:132 start_codon:yes stop_codon:yes gene_type:complete